MKKDLEIQASKAIQETNEKIARGRNVEVLFEQEKLANIEAMLKTRKKQQQQLEKVENDLREKARQIKAEQETLTQLQQGQDEGVALAVSKEAGLTANQNRIPHLSPKEYRSLSQEEKAELKARREASGNQQQQVPSAIELDHHPVLGPVIADLGYKRIHLVSSGKLGTIPIWKRQRTYRNDRARSMAADKQSSMNLGFPGIICLFEDSNGGLSILDGQHRVGMMQALRELRNKQMGDASESAGPWSSSQQTDEALFQNVLVEVYSSRPNQNDTAVAEQVFIEINKAEPLKLVDMPGVASPADRKLITEAVTTLQKQFPKMFSPSQRCRAPNVNIDNLRSSIFGANILERHKNDITSSKNLVDWLMVQNAALGDKYENDEQKRKSLSTKTWTKASKNSFYLGLESSWLYF
jgi:hypothetical protein